MNNSPQHSRKLHPWASGAYRLEAFLFYRPLKHSNLNLKHNFSYQKASQGDTVRPCLKNTKIKQNEQKVGGGPDLGWRP